MNESNEYHHEITLTDLTNTEISIDDLLDSKNETKVQKPLAQEV